jgi:hypothetical protein
MWSTGGRCNRVRYGRETRICRILCDICSGDIYQFSGEVKMGFFSWKTSDTGKSIPNVYSGGETFTVVMLDNTGRRWIESAYEGYGDFGGMDYYALVDTMNGGDGDRDRGIKLAFGDKPVLLPKLVTKNCQLEWDDLPDPETCEHQGYFYE